MQALTLAADAEPMRAMLAERRSSPARWVGSWLFLRSVEKRHRCGGILHRYGLCAGGTMSARGNFFR
jgi:hypothetical protein